MLCPFLSPEKTFLLVLAIHFTDKKIHGVKTEPTRNKEVAARQHKLYCILSCTRKWGNGV